MIVIFCYVLLFVVMRRTMKQLRDMHRYAMELFRILFLRHRQPRLQPCMLQEAKSLIEKSLLGFHDFVTVAAQINATCNSYPLFLY